MPYQSEQEKLNYQEIVNVFENSHHQIEVALTQIPQSDYGNQLKQWEELTDVLINDTGMDQSSLVSLQPL